MKRTKILALAAVLFAVGSAFTAKETVNARLAGLFMYDSSTPQQCVTDNVCLTSGHVACNWQSYSAKISQFVCQTPINSFKN